MSFFTTLASLFTPAIAIPKTASDLANPDSWQRQVLASLFDRPSRADTYNASAVEMARANRAGRSSIEANLAKNPFSRSRARGDYPGGPGGLGGLGGPGFGGYAGPTRQCGKRRVCWWVEGTLVRELAENLACDRQGLIFRHASGKPAVIQRSHDESVVLREALDVVAVTEDKSVSPEIPMICVISSIRHPLMNGAHMKRSTTTIASSIVWSLSM